MEKPKITFWPTQYKVFKLILVSQVAQWFKKKKDPPANAGDVGDKGSSPGSGRPSGGENGNPL